MKAPVAHQEHRDPAPEQDEPHRDHEQAAGDLDRVPVLQQAGAGEADAELINGACDGSQGGSVLRRHAPLAVFPRGCENM